jgi:hypothetical protein
MCKVIRRKFVISNGYVHVFRTLITGIIVEELVKDSLGREGHKIFLEDEEDEEPESQDADSPEKEVESEAGKTPQNMDSEEDSEAVIEL